MSESKKVPDTPRTEFFEGSIHEANSDVPLVVRVSAAYSPSSAA
jgi:hypothetical protein